MARAKKHERTAARESALALLYSSDITENSVADIVDAGCYPADDIEFAPYAEALVRGVQAHLDDIDGFLESTSENWALDRMPVVDRAILRLAVYEMRYVDEVPVSVTINEAVELAKAYGGEDDSSRFVNGVLGRIARKMETGLGASVDAARVDDADAVDADAAAAEDVAATEAAAPLSEDDFDAVAGELITEPFKDKAE